MLLFQFPPIDQDKFAVCYEVWTGDDIKNKDSGDEYEFNKIINPQDTLALYIAKSTNKTINTVNFYKLFSMIYIITCIAVSLLYVINILPYTNFKPL